MGNFLDNSGITHLWKKIHTAFAEIKHTHTADEVGHQSIKTINGTSMVGTGNITVLTEHQQIRTLDGCSLVGKDNLPFKRVEMDTIIGEGNISIPDFQIDLIVQRVNIKRTELHLLINKDIYDEIMVGKGKYRIVMLRLCKTNLHVNKSRKGYYRQFHHVWVPGTNRTQVMFEPEIKEYDDNYSNAALCFLSPDSYKNKIPVVVGFFFNNADGKHIYSSDLTDFFDYESGLFGRDSEGRIVTPRVIDILKKGVWALAIQEATDNPYQGRIVSNLAMFKVYDATENTWRHILPLPRQ